MAARNVNGRYRGEGGADTPDKFLWRVGGGIRAGYATATPIRKAVAVGGTFERNADGTLNMPLIVDFAERSFVSWWSIEGG